MKTKCVTLVVILASIALLAAASPKLAMSWKNPSYTTPNFKNILVLALNGKAANRAEFEDELVAVIQRVTPIDMNDLRELVKEQNFDAILVARLTKADKKTTYVPGDVYTPIGYYNTFYGYYGAVYPIVYSPGYMVTEKEAQVEVNFYSTAKPDGELVWTGTTNVFDADSAMKVIKELVKMMTKELEKANVVPRPSK
jgi:hypothetical protein